MITNEEVSTHKYAPQERQTPCNCQGNNISPISPAWISSTDIDTITRSCENQDELTDRTRTRSFRAASDYASTLTECAGTPVLPGRHGSQPEKQAHERPNIPSNITKVLMLKSRPDGFIPTVRPHQIVHVSTYPLLIAAKW
ncbi:hypothetical protein OOZ19_14455 [Saccharopolyspora sp. NFXS83]|uniref:hypothetical protein n=1 Tax=Saccharopolyspora sp. NFXS83 TaxID=2993560 RepID=UPI00224B619F|nr:hypothetical protein [Saccharopolyspora sp. NFXS83]MCX2731443.1 hypothetical protein [Saccharopolyspora sp. NFXS83]